MKGKRFLTSVKLLGWTMASPNVQRIARALEPTSFSVPVVISGSTRNAVAFVVDYL